MKIARKSFLHPCTRSAEKEMNVGFFRTKLEKVRYTEDIPWGEFMKDVTAFINKLGSSVVSISEYTEARFKIGDDGFTRIVVWYWDYSDHFSPQRGSERSEP